jgi:regulator of replication initiation timing
MKVLKELLDMSSNKYNHMLLKQYVIKLERENIRLESENEKLKIRIGLLENPEFEPYPDGKEMKEKNFYKGEK